MTNQNKIKSIEKPVVRPDTPNFSSGPCAKRPGWNTDLLGNAFLGRSHRAKEGKACLRALIDKTHKILELPSEYRVGIVPGSDTGAFEMAMWSLLGARGVDVLAWESFGKGWVGDITAQLKLEDVRLFESAYGELPDLSRVDMSRDIVFTMNGTTSGVRVPDLDWVASDRTGLTLIDATSAVFAQHIDWAKADVVTFSWQKVLGGEAAHGMIILSPRAVSRLENYVPAWPMPKVFRMTKGGKLIDGIFEGETVNTPSMLCVEDCLDALAWAESVGGANGMRARADANARVLHEWVSRTDWVANLAQVPATMSNTSVCLQIVDAEVRALPDKAQRVFAKRIAALLDEENVARDIGSYRDAPAGLRIWTGATIEVSDLEALTPWIEWAFLSARAESALG